MGLREEVVKWATWGVTNHRSFNYSEGVQRMEAINEKPGTLPVTADCSAFVTLCYKWAGAPDPNGLNYNGEGYTGTLLSHGEHIPLSEVQPGDVIVYGPGTGWHTAIVVKAGPDPMTVSHGQQGDPSFVRVSRDGRTPQTYLRFLPVEGAAPAPAPAAPAAQPQIGEGAKGAPVFKLQQLLELKGIRVKVDGIFGVTTTAAVRQFQQAHHINVDGICGPVTWKALGA
jgi:peptidoglycan hydrolase-like protein with peptidoglycan-binding domain